MRLRNALCILAALSVPFGLAASLSAPPTMPLTIRTALSAPVTTPCVATEHNSVIYFYALEHSRCANLILDGRDIGPEQPLTLSSNHLYSFVDNDANYHEQLRHIDRARAQIDWYTRQLRAINAQLAALGVQ